MEGRRRSRCHHHRFGTWSAAATALLWVLLAGNNGRGAQELGERGLVETLGGGGGGVGWLPQMPMVSINARCAGGESRAQRQRTPSSSSTGGVARPLFKLAEFGIANALRKRLSSGAALPPENEVALLVEDLKDKGRKFSEAFPSSTGKSNGEQQKQQTKRSHFVTGSPMVWTIFATSEGRFLTRRSEPHPVLGVVTHDLIGEYPHAGLALLPLIHCILATLDQKAVPIYDLFGSDSSSSPSVVRTFSAAYSGGGSRQKKRKLGKGGGGGGGGDVDAGAARETVYGAAFLITPQVRKDAEALVKLITGFVDTTGNDKKNAEIAAILGKDSINIFPTTQLDNSNNNSSGGDSQGPLGSHIAVVPKEAIPAGTALLSPKVYTVDSAAALKTLLSKLTSFRGVVGFELPKVVDDVLNRYVGHKRSFPSFNFGINDGGSGFVVPRRNVQTEKSLLDELRNAPIGSDDTDGLEFVFVPMRSHWKAHCDDEKLSMMSITFHRSRSKEGITAKKQETSGRRTATRT